MIHPTDQASNNNKNLIEKSYTIDDSLVESLTSNPTKNNTKRICFYYDTNLQKFNTEELDLANTTPEANSYLFQDIEEVVKLSNSILAQKRIFSYIIDILSNIYLFFIIVLSISFLILILANLMRNTAFLLPFGKNY